MSSYAVITKTLHRTRPGADHTARFVRRPGGSSANRHRHISRTQTSGPHRGASLSAHNFKAAHDPPAIPSLVGNWWLLLLPGADRWVAPPSPLRLKPSSLPRMKRRVHARHPWSVLAGSPESALRLFMGSPFVG